jgi:hypothetical protein
MFRALAKLFRKPQAPKQPFVDDLLGEFAFDRDLGWKKEVLLGGTRAELLLGWDGEPPSEEMLKTARSWIEEWPNQFPKIIEYIRQAFPVWVGDPTMPVPERFEVESIQIAWRKEPRTSMIYLHYPGDDIRGWRIIFHGFEPSWIGFDD